MDGIEKITGRIAADTEAEIASIQAEARRQADEITARYEAQAKREYPHKNAWNKALCPPDDFL